MLTENNILSALDDARKQVKEAEKRLDEEQNAINKEVALKRFDIYSTADLIEASNYLDRMLKSLVDFYFACESAMVSLDDYSRAGATNLSANTLHQMKDFFEETIDTFKQLKTSISADLNGMPIANSNIQLPATIDAEKILFFWTQYYKNHPDCGKDEWAIKKAKKKAQEDERRAKQKYYTHEDIMEHMRSLGYDANYKLLSEAIRYALSMGYLARNPSGGYIIDGDEEKRTIEYIEQEYKKRLDKAAQEDRQNQTQTIYQNAAPKVTQNFAPPPKKIKPKRVKKESQGKNKIQFIALIAVVAILFIAVAVLVTSYIIIPAAKYNKAVKLWEERQNDEAYAILETLDGYKDSEEIMDKIDYQRATRYIELNQLKKAYILLAKLGGYKDSREKMRQIEVEHPYYTMLLSEPGDVITFGEYEQDNDTSNGKEPIEWIVLSVRNEEVYLLSKYVLDAQPLNEKNTKDCTLDDWLKTGFSQNAFTPEANKAISRIDLLPKDYIKNYGLTMEQIQPKYTKYALAQNPYKGSASGLMWWLAPDSYSISLGKVAGPVVCEVGSYERNVCDVTDPCGVRPALWLFCD